MRIALVIERFEPRGGGVEAVAWKVAHALAAAGDQVHVVARLADDARALEIQRVPVPSTWQPLRVLAFSRAAGRAAPRDAFDAVQSFSRTRHQDVFRAGGGCHAAYLERAHGPLGARLRRLTPRHATLLALEDAVFRDPSQFLLCNSEMVSEEIGERYGVTRERLWVIPNGVDGPRFAQAANAAAGARLRAALAPEAERVWLLVGTGFRRKGVDTAIAALAKSGRTRDVLWIAGADAPEPWRARAAAAGVAERVQFLGLRDDLPALYAACDALLLPTRYDAFANVCLEAAAAGRAVITSGANGAAGWLGGGARVVAHPNDISDFASALCELADDSVREPIAASGAARAAGATWEAHVQALHRLYARVAAQ